MAEVKLLPCPTPWCEKSKPELQQGGYRNRHFRVECQTCFTKGPTRDDLNGGGPEAIAAWNHRPNSNTVEVLREALSKCRDKFAEYVKLHSAKLWPERAADEFYQNANTAHNAEVREKIARNQEMVDLCDSTLNTLTQGEG